MRRSTVALERGDPLFEQAGLAVNVSRFPALRQQSLQQQASRLLATAGLASASTTASAHSSQEALLTVRALAGTGVVNQEPVLRIEVVSEDHDPFVLYLAEITLESFAALKEEQALRVNFEGFSHHVVQLLEKCAQGEFRLALSAAEAATTPETSAHHQDDVSTSNAAILNVFETTSFRELSHLSLRLDRATETQTRQYLWERLRQENRRVTSLQTLVKRSDQDIKSKGDEVKDILAQLEAVKLQLSAERSEFQSAMERRHADALKEARLQVSDEDRRLKEQNSQRIMELETRLRQMEEELAKTKEAKAEAEAEVLRRSGASDALGPLRAEANELRTRCREFESRAFEESARSARLQEHVTGLERELALREDTASRTNELLKSEREKISKLTTELEEAKSQVKESNQKLAAMEAREKDALAKRDAIQDEVEALTQKVKTKNLVIREQERVVKDHEHEIQRLKASVQDAEQNISIERTKNTELRTKIQELKQHLEESAKTLEANASVITYLNRELSAASGGGFFPSVSTSSYDYPLRSSAATSSSIPGPSATDKSRRAWAAPGTSASATAGAKRKGGGGREG